METIISITVFFIVILVIRVDKQSKELSKLRLNNRKLTMNEDKLNREIYYYKKLSKSKSLFHKN